MSNVVPFPDQNKHGYYRLMREELVERGLYGPGEKIPPDLLDFIGEWLDSAYEAGIAGGLQLARDREGGA